MMDREECCGTCQHHRSCNNAECSDWICENEMSEAYGLPTEYSDKCEEWEKR